MKRNMLHLLLFLTVFYSEAFSCTIIMVRDNDIAIAGSNEDFLNPLTMIWFVPASDRYYARICFGFNMGMNSTQGGINEHGLFIDGNSLQRQGWSPDSAKDTFMGSVIDHILASYRTIDEVKEFFMTYNIPALDQARLPVMDRSGASMIVEWYDGRVVFLESEEDYQVATNFVGSQYQGKEKPCWRYNTAVELLGSQDHHSVTAVRDALDATHVEGSRIYTLYTFICDLKTGEIYIYNFHDYSRPIKLKFNEEISKGTRSLYLAEMFGDHSSEYLNFVKEAPLMMLDFFSSANNIRASILYGIMRSKYPDLFHITIGPEVLSEYAASLASRGRFDDSVFFLERNARDFPDHPSVHYELAEALLRAGKTERAISEYRKTLELDPGHAGAREAIKKLE